MIWIVLLLFNFAEAKTRLTKIDSCQSPATSAKSVMIIKQWHLAPTTITKGFKEKYPQEKNQTAIYQELNELVRNKKIQLVLSEGCEGSEINSEFTPTFNGWDYESLSKQSQTRGYDKIVSLIPLKLEARHKDKLATWCGDNEKLIQEGNLRLSNLRGWVGFLTRLSEPSTDEKLKMYSETAAELLKVPKETPVAELKQKIREQLKSDLDLFVESLHGRNESFVKALNTHEFTRAAIVIGGLHVKDLKEKIQAAGFGCDVWSPPGYQSDDENIVSDFERLLKN